MGSIPTPGIVNSPVALSLSTVLWVALGGALGSTLRFAAGDALRRLPAAAGFPWATLAVNVVGSFAIGWFMRWASVTEASPSVRAFVAIGVCGGFTTFSTFAAENLVLLQEGQVTRAAAHAVLSLALTVGAAYLGFLTARG